MDLLDLYRRNGKLSIRKLGVLVNHLPPESATITALRNSVTPEVAAMSSGMNNDPTKAQWSMVEMLLATIVDGQRNMQYLYTSAHSDKEPGPPPEPMPRPGVKAKPTRRQLTMDQRRMLDPRLRAVPDTPPEPPPAGPVGVSIG
jgi:hypothetical protein